MVGMWSVEMKLNKLAIQKYEALIQENYKEPIDGKFEDITAAILEKINGA